MTKLVTPARLLVLEYVRDHEPVGAFPMGLSMVRRCEELGLIETAGQEKRPFGFVTYRLTDTGRAALQEENGRG